jgi:hypothetical protein
MFHLIRLDPVRGNVLLIAPANSTAFGLANLGPGIQLTLAIEIGSECPKVLGLDQRMQRLMGLPVDLGKRLLKFLPTQQHKHRQNDHHSKVDLEHAV